MEDVSHRERIEALLQYGYRCRMRNRYGGYCHARTGFVARIGGIPLPVCADHKPTQGSSQ